MIIHVWIKYNTAMKSICNIIIFLQPQSCEWDKEKIETKSEVEMLNPKTIKYTYLNWKLITVKKLPLRPSYE
jgi:hypothetical protein